ncbi:MAG: hypothetical protein ACNYPD_05375 [Candidatus Halichondribacter symbioticus]
MTLSLKNTIPTLALLVAILMISGCGASKALDDLASDAEDAFDRFGEDLKNKGIESLSNTDPCREQSVLFGDRTLCSTPEHNLARESQCTFAFNAALCADTVTRVCDANINKPLCEGKAGYATLHTQGLTIVDESDWRVSFLDEYLDVTPRGETPNPDVGTNLFLGDLTSEKLARYRITDIFLIGFTDNISDGRKRDLERIFTIEDADVAVGTLTLADTHSNFHGFKGVTTSGVETDIGDVNDGVSFVAGQFNSGSDDCIGNPNLAECATHRYYAGIHASTDLGAPLAEAPTSGTWRGLLRMVGQNELTTVPFDLDITFRRSASSGTIKADFDSAGRYVIDATFDRFGAITGDITVLGSAGTISGIIGQEGAVAAFISDETGVRDASSALGYAGGFVAYVPNSPPTGTSTEISASADACVKDNTCVDYARWEAAANPTDAPMPNEFLKGTTVGLAGVDQGNVTGSSSLANLNPPGDRDDGYAFYLPDATGSVHNIGIYSTTRLGAPLSNTITKAQWPGLLHERSGTDAITSSPITLSIDFNAGAEAGTINGKNGVNRLGLYEIAARFDDKGVITGTIVRTNKPGEAITGANTGAIAGLIGAEGVVAVFRNHTSSTVSFVGGFLALPPITVDYAQWVTVANPTDTPMPNEFLKGTRNGLMGTTRPEIGGLTNTAANAHNHASTHILNAGDAGDGFAVYRATKTGEIHNVGILSTTDLGAPLTGTITNVQWPGSLLARVGTGLTIPSLITLNVSFDGTSGTIAGSNSLSNFAILARFNNVGVISGDVTHTQRLPNNVLTGGSGPVTGLIGADGAVAVFRNSTNSRTNYVGGFVAQPSQGIAADPCIARNTCVDYAHWEAAANPTDTPTPDRFLKGTPRGLAGVGAPTDVANLSLKDNTNFYPALNDGDDKDGFGLYRPINAHSSGSTHNVGIYSTTNLGAPLRGTFANARWAGLLRDRVGTVIADLGVRLNVGFNDGTKAGTITYGSAGTKYQIDADFDGTGVISGDITRRVTGDTSTGTISGLIGAEGAVGVFHSNVGATTSYVGGFVAHPPAPNG